MAGFEELKREALEKLRIPKLPILVDFYAICIIVLKLGALLELFVMSTSIFRMRC